MILMRRDLKKNKKSVLIVLLLVMVLIAISVTVMVNKNNRDNTEYPYLSKRLFSENKNDIIVNFAPLRTQINNYLKDVNIESSTYIEYLPTGVSIRIGDNEQLVGASLMKVPVVMDLYKASEQQKINLDQEVLVEKTDLSSAFGELYKASDGTKIKLKDAAMLTLTQSDNTALNIVLKHTQEKTNLEDRSLNFLDVEQTQSEDGNRLYISARSYSSFFKCLYLSCYLNYYNSNYLLELMTKTPFNDLLVAGVNDSSIPISHKIGTFNQEVTSDCGIVYVPKRPYLICTMFKSDKESAKKYIQDISRMTYNYINDIKSSKD